MWAALHTYTRNSAFQEKINIGLILASTQRHKKNFCYYLEALIQVRLSIPAHLAAGKSLKPRNYSNHAHRPFSLNYSGANSAEPLPLPIQPMKQRHTCNNHKEQVLNILGICKVIPSNTESSHCAGNIQRSCVSVREGMHSTKSRLERQRVGDPCRLQL